jgi:predicted MPP superfamily phosphohydrolase
VALVSDIHAGAGHMTAARVDAVVDAVAALDADVVLLVGDYLDSTWLGRGRAQPVRVARQLARLEGAVAVLGNHDWRAAGYAMKRALEDAGVPVLENAARELRPGLWVGGAAEYRFRVPNVSATLAAAPRDAAVLLMIHDPDLFPQVPERVSLTVAGHLHGGQVNVPLLRRVMLPSRFGERYLAGHVVEDGRHLYVSAGLGTSGLPVRLRRPPEIPLLVLRSAPDS